MLMRFKVLLQISRMFAAAAVASPLLAIIQNLDTGFSREVKPHAKGKFQSRNPPAGAFSITVKHPDGTIGESRVVTRRVGMTPRFP